MKNVRSPLPVMFLTDTELFYVISNHETCFNRNTREIVIVSSVVPIFWVSFTFSCKSHVVCFVLLVIAQFFGKFLCIVGLEKERLLLYMEYGKSINFYAFFEDKFLQT